MFVYIYKCTQWVLFNVFDVSHKVTADAIQSLTKWLVQCSASAVILSGRLTPPPQEDHLKPNYRSWLQVLFNPAQYGYKCRLKYCTEPLRKDTSILLPVFKYKFDRLSAPVLGESYCARCTLSVPGIPKYSAQAQQYPNTVGWKIRWNTERSENHWRACSHWNTGRSPLSVPYRGLTM